MKYSTKARSAPFLEFSFQKILKVFAGWPHSSIGVAKLTLDLVRLLRYCISLLPPSMQLQQGNTATDFLQTAVRRLPLQLFTNLPRQLYPRKTRLTVDHLLDSCDAFPIDFLPANFHAGNLPISPPPCPVKSYGTRSAQRRGELLCNPREFRDRN